MKRPLPPGFFMAAVCLAVVLHLLLPLKQFIVLPWRLAGLLPLGTGIVLNLLADRTFKRRDTTVKPFEEPSILITDGVFGISRNPMYLGMILLLFGISLLLGSASPFAAVVALAILFDRIFISHE